MLWTSSALPTTSAVGAWPRIADFRMGRFARHDDLVSVVGEFNGQRLDSAHERARRVHDREASALRLFDHGRLQAVTANQQDAAFGRLVQRFNHAQTFLRQAGHLLRIVDERAEAIDGLALGERFGGQADGAADAEAYAASGSHFDRGFVRFGVPPWLPGHRFSSPSQAPARRRRRSSF